MNEHLQQILISLQTLGRCTSNNWGDGPPLSWHQLGQVQQLLVLLARPFCLLDAGIQPLVPTSLALLGWLPMQQWCDTRPLVFAIFHHSRFEDFILKYTSIHPVAPDAEVENEKWSYNLVSSNERKQTSVLRQTPPFIIIRGMVVGLNYTPVVIIIRYQ